MGGPSDPVGIKENVNFSLKRATPPKTKTLISKITEYMSGVRLYITSFFTSEEESDDGEDDEDDGSYLISHIVIGVDNFNPFFIS